MDCQSTLVGAVIVVGALGLQGCGQGAPSSPTAVPDQGGPTASAVVSASKHSAGIGQEACEALTGTLVESGNILATLTGSIAGDLVGSAEGSHDSSRFRLTGNPAFNFAGHNHGERTWQISGGSVPALAGRTLQLSFDAIAANPRPGFQLTGDWHETAQVVAGARSGHLTLNGTIDGSGGFPSFVFTLTYRGEICP